VLALDAVTYFVFAAAALAVRRPLPAGERPLPAGERPGARTGRLVPLLRDRVLVATTLAFMAFNVATGMLLVTGPWLAKTQLDGGAQSLGLLMGAMSAGELIGSVLAARRSSSPRGIAAIAAVQLCAGAAFLAVAAAPYAGFLLVGLCMAPMTVWAQSLRMRRIPAHLRGRGFAILRTLMQATPPTGAALVTPLLDGGRLVTAATVMAALAGLPALALLMTRHRLTDEP
jgi:hypothetical protein